MRYTYKLKTEEELESIAVRIRQKAPGRIDGFVVDIEGIIEDFGISLLPRGGGLHDLVYGYTPKDPHYIVMAAAEASYPPFYRAIAAEEFCHIVLEWNLYQPGKELPPGAEGHDLAYGERQEIEQQAKYLAAAVVLPKQEFIARYRHHENTVGWIGPDVNKTIRAIISHVSKDFEIIEIIAGMRARDLKLLTHEEFKANYSDRLQF